MKRIHNARHPADAHLIRDFLESCGIAAVVRGEWLAGGIGELPADACSVWIKDDARFHEADGVLKNFLQGKLQPASPCWQCPHCNERSEGQFTQCWQCGATRPD